jgi:hypothetical protein
MSHGSLQLGRYRFEIHNGAMGNGYLHGWVSAGAPGDTGGAIVQLCPRDGGRSCLLTTTPSGEYTFLAYHASSSILTAYPLADGGNPEAMYASAGEFENVTMPSVEPLPPG